MSGAQPVKVTSRASFPIADERVEILDAEGAVQLIFMLDGWPDGSRPRFNFFCGPKTADELQAVVDALRARPWPEAANG